MRPGLPGALRIGLRARRQRRRRVHPADESLAAEHCLANGGYPRPEIAPDTGKRIGIVGSGPAGLTAAYYLRTLGHQVEIFESQEHAGGMLRYGIPAYRLPPDLLDQELDQIKVLGIPIHTGAKIDSLEDFRKDYDAVFVGPGTQTARAAADRRRAPAASCSAASISCAPCAAARRCAWGRAWWWSAAATSPSTSR